MEESCIPKMILRREIATGCKAWMGEILKICEYLDIPSLIVPLQSFYTYDLEPIERRLLVRCREEWREAALPMPKLSPYIRFKDFTEAAPMVKMNLPRGSEASSLSCSEVSSQFSWKLGGIQMSNVSNACAGSAIVIRLKMNFTSCLCVHVWKNVGKGQSSH